MIKGKRAGGRLNGQMKVKHAIISSNFNKNRISLASKSKQIKTIVGSPVNHQQQQQQRARLAAINNSLMNDHSYGATSLTSSPLGMANNKPTSIINHQSRPLKLSSNSQSLLSSSLANKHAGGKSGKKNPHSTNHSSKAFQSLIKSSSKVNINSNGVNGVVDNTVPGSKSHIVHTRSKSGVRCPKQMPREYVSPKKGAQIHASGSANGRSDNDALISSKPSGVGSSGSFGSLSSAPSLINSNRQNINSQAANQHNHSSKSNGQMFVKNSSCSSPTSSSSRSLKRANNENHYSHGNKSFKSSAPVSQTIRIKQEIVDDDDMLDDSSLSSNSSQSSNLSMDSSSLDSEKNVRHFANIKSESSPAFRNHNQSTSHSLSNTGNSSAYAAGQHSPMSSPLSPNTNSSQKSSSSCSSNKSIPPARRREHNEQERARRHNLRNAFLYLRDQLPDLSKKAPRIRILCNAYDVVTQLIKQNRQLQRIKAQEAKKKASLLAAKAKLQQLGIEID